MVKREWIRIAICAVIGLIVGIIVAVNNNAIQYAFISPFYGIGTFYGIKLILAMLGGVGKTAGQSVFSSIAGGHWFGFLIIVIIFVIVVGLILVFGWILGIFAAGKALFDAYRTDSEIGSNRPQNDSWDDGSDNNTSSHNNSDW